MALANTPTSRNLVIASVQSGSYATPIFQEGDTAPEYRPNGGDLVAGDHWYDTTTEYLYMWNGYSWVPIGGEGLFTQLEAIMTRLDTLENMFANGILDAGRAEIATTSPY